MGAGCSVGRSDPRSSGTRGLPCVAVRPWTRHLNAPRDPAIRTPLDPLPQRTLGDSSGRVRPGGFPSLSANCPPLFRVSAPRRGRRAPREARVPRLENERCPEGGPELQVTRASPRPGPSGLRTRAPSPRGGHPAPTRGLCAPAGPGASWRRGAGWRGRGQLPGGGTNAPRLSRSAVRAAVPGSGGRRRRRL